MKPQLVSKEKICFSIAKELQSLAGDRRNLSKFRELYSEFRKVLHANHYLLLLLKRHIVVLSSGDFQDMDMEQLKVGLMSE